MTIDFAAPAFLWLLAGLPILWLAGRVRRTGLPTRQGYLHPVARGCVLVCLVGALAQPVLSLPASRLAMVYLVDMSSSVSARALDLAAKEIDELNNGLRPDSSRILAFGGRTAGVKDTAELRRLATTEAAGQLDDQVRADETNLEQALASARAEIPPATAGRIVLWSDGRVTHGDTRRATERLVAERIPVFTETQPARNLGDAWVEDLRLPRAPVARAIASVDVAVGSQSERPVAVELREGQHVLGGARLDLAKGAVAVARIDVSFPTPGAHLVEAIIQAERDTLAENNRLIREVIVEPRPKVLYVHGEAEDARVAPVALAQSGVEITTAKPGVLPKTAEAFDRWDVVVLSNVGRSVIAPEAMAALGTWVEERGGGLLFIGGDAVFGEGLDGAQTGYRRTEIERVLPVTFDRDDEPEVALVIVLDRSWSMNGPAMELSKTAAEAAANTLSPSQLLGVLTFNNLPNWDIPVTRVRQSRPTLHDAIASINASGPTNIFLALEEAYAALAGVKARAKHVILLSDGQTAAEDFEGLVGKMSAAQITVSSVALGPEADATLLKNIATWGGGRSYVVTDAKQVPEIFVKEAKSAGTSGSDESGAIAAVVRQAGWLGDSAAAVPAIQGRNAVTRKAQALELLGSPRGDPLMTIWPAGLGRTAMLATDVDGRWTKDWVSWRGFGAFLSTIVQTLAPRRVPASALTVTGGERQGTARNLEIALEARDPDGARENLLSPVVSVARPGAGAATLGLTQVAPGRYETRVLADTSEPLTFSLAAARDDSRAGATRIFADDRAAEYRFGPPNEQLLASIARDTGGAVHPKVDDIRRAPRTSGIVRHALAPWLLAFALVLWPVDIVLRRFRR